MRQTRSQEPLLPPWVAAIGLRLGPLAVLSGLYFVLTKILHVPARILIPTLGVLALAAFVYFVGRLYKPFRVDKQGRCTARSGKERMSCRHFIPGAKLGAGCGRLRESGLCRRVR